jgi:hypothetical protein
MSLSTASDVPLNLFCTAADNGSLGTAQQIFLTVAGSAKQLLWFQTVVGMIGTFLR